MAENSKTQLSGRELILIMTFVPMVLVWLVLAARMVWAASSNPETLDNMEGLLAILAILTTPVTVGLMKVIEGYGNGKKE